MDRLETCFKSIHRFSKNAIYNAKKFEKSHKFFDFFAIYRYFLQFFELFSIICIVCNLSQDHKIRKFTVFYTFFCNAPKFTPFFVPHCKKFMVGQGKFYDGKFTAVNSKKA